MSLFYSQRPVIEAKTASYQLTAQDEGKLFTNRGAAGAVVFTLPVTTNLPSGWKARFYSMVAQDFTVSASVAGTIVGYNDLTCDAYVFSTSGDEIGNGAEFVWDGTSWLAFLMVEGAVVVTVTSA
jgi:nitric oxide reductase large subunit